MWVAHLDRTAAFKEPSWIPQVDLAAVGSDLHSRSQLLQDTKRCTGSRSSGLLFRLGILN